MHHPLKEIDHNVVVNGYGQQRKVTPHNEGQPTCTTCPASSLTQQQVVTVYKKSKTGEITAQKFYQGQCLGKGAFAVCYEMTNVQTGEVFAGKITAKEKLQTPNQKAKLITEAKIHRSLKHPHIVAFYNAYEDEHNYYFIMEKCNQRSLRDLLRRKVRLSDDEVRYYMLQLLHALKYLQNQLVIHRDLKLDNIFLHDNQVKLGDFGLAAKLSHPSERKRTVCGTPNYISPEVLAKTGHGLEVDIWAFGVVMYALLIGTPPFETKAVEATYDRIRRNDYSFPPDIPISNEAKELIQKLLNPIPEQRPTIDEIYSHPFFAKANTQILPIPAIPSSSSSSIITPTIQPSAPSMAFAGTASGSVSVTSALSSIASSTSNIAAAVQRTNVTQAANNKLQIQHVDVMPQRVLRSFTRRIAAGIVTSQATEPSKTTSGLDSSASSSRKRKRADINKIETAPSTGAGPCEPTRQTRRNSLEPAEERKKARISQGMPFSKRLSYKFALTRNTAADEVHCNHCVDYIGYFADCLQSLLQSLTRNLENGSPRQLRSSSRLQRKRLGAEFDVKSVKHRWIIKWVDYSHQWGLGYQYSDGTVGVVFNCGSIMSLSPCEPVIMYIPPVGSMNTVRKELLDANDEFRDNPHIRKRAQAIRFTKKFLESAKASPGLEGIGEDRIPDDGLAYVQQWIRTQHGILFWMSDHSLQANFVDHTKIYVSTNVELITYINVHIECNTYHKSELAHSPYRTEIVDRLRYILTCVNKHFRTSPTPTPL